MGVRRGRGLGPWRVADLLRSDLAEIELPPGCRHLVRVEHEPCGAPRVVAEWSTRHRRIRVTVYPCATWLTAYLLPDETAWARTRVMPGVAHGDMIGLLRGALDWLVMRPGPRGPWVAPEPEGPWEGEG